MTQYTADALSAPHSQREMDMIEDGGSDRLQGAKDALAFAQGDTSKGVLHEAGDLIIREAAVGYHATKLREAKENAASCRNDDEEAACGYLEEAILHSDAINALRAIPSAQPTAEVRALHMQALADAGQMQELQTALAAMTENAKALAEDAAFVIALCAMRGLGDAHTVNDLRVSVDNLNKLMEGK